MNNIILLLSCTLLLILVSCGYPDLDNVPNFKDIILTDEEITDYCNSNNTNNKDIEKCINDYKSNN